LRCPCLHHGGSATGRHRLSLIANGAFGVNGCYFRLQFGAECTQGSLAVPPSRNYHLDMEEEVDVRGLYRTPGFAFVTDNTMTFDIPEAEYREYGYTPEYDSLPSKDAYKASLTSKGANR
jgi:hypothetical protein